MGHVRSIPAPLEISQYPVQIRPMPVYATSDETVYPPIQPSRCFNFSYEMPRINDLVRWVDDRVMRIKRIQYNLHDLRVVVEFTNP